MKKINFTIMLLITLFFISNQAKSQITLHEDAEVSLLTASPWNGAVYALFGHTAIYIHDDSTGVDAVFNYGYFDPTQPNFIYNFIRGKTDYILGVDFYDQFIAEYSYKGQKVTKQILNLSAAEKQQLYNALYINSLPENRGYRYNYFYDNCSTRPRDMIEKYTNGVIAYLPTPQNQTYRDLLHERLDGYSWVIFGIDLLIGTEADRTIDLREKMFLPSYLMDSFDGATIQKNDTLSYSLVKNRSVILSHDNEKNSMREQGTFTPLLTAFVLL